MTVAGLTFPLATMQCDPGANTDYSAHRVRGGRMHAGEQAHE